MLRRMFFKASGNGSCWTMLERLSFKACLIYRNLSMFLSLKWRALYSTPSISFVVLASNSRGHGGRRVGPFCTLVCMKSFINKKALTFERISPLLQNLYRIARHFPLLSLSISWARCCCCRRAVLNTMTLLSVGQQGTRLAEGERLPSF